MSHARHLVVTGVVAGTDALAAAVAEGVVGTSDDCSGTLAPVVVASAGDVALLPGTTVVVADAESAALLAERALCAGLLVQRIDPPPAPIGAQLLALVGVEQRLLAPGGCPWDREQTHRSLARHLLEESYEVLEAIDRVPVTADLPGGMRPDAADVVTDAVTEGSASLGRALLGSAGVADALPTAALVEELGDLLLQVVFHAELGRVAGRFDIDDVARGIREKLVRRHPHVFADAQVATSAEVVTNWETIKREQEGRTEPFSGIPAALPALQYAAKVQSRALSAGLAVPVLDPAARAAASLGRLVELDAQESLEPEAVQRCVGELLDNVVALARTLGVDAEGALRRWARQRVSDLDPPT